MGGLLGDHQGGDANDPNNNMDRFRSMSLQTLPSTKRERFKQLKFDRVTNRLDDIQGARHEDKWAKFTHKPNFVDNADIQGSKSMTLHRSLRKFDRQLYVDDIDGAQSRPKTFKTKRVVNPLVPHYKLPSVKVAVPPQPSFIRNSIDNSDLPETHVQPLYKWQQRDTYTCGDIEGAQAGWRPRHERARREAEPNEIMKVDDIVFDGVFHSTRRTNPLDPAYDVNGMHIENDQRYSKPRKLPKRKNCPFFSLCNEDIEGARPGWKSPGEIRPLVESRRVWHNTNFVGDIVGAQADTVVHSIKTDRHVNPLNPTYISLDGEPLANPITPLYKDPATIEANMVLQSAMDKAAAAKVARERAGSTHQKPPAVDPRDAIIENLTKQVDSLRAAGGQASSSSSATPQKHRTPPPRPLPSSQQASSEAAASPANHASPSQQAPSNFVAPVPALVESQLPSGIFLRTDSGSVAAERLILRSSDGKPRVSLTPAEVQAAKVTLGDIEAVKNLR